MRPSTQFFLVSETQKNTKTGVFKVPEAGYVPKNTFATPHPLSVLDISGMLYQKNGVF
jgi:hypothetical protein